MERKVGLLERAKALRGVPASELQQRMRLAQSLMGEAELDAVLVTTQEDFYYFTGLFSRFWHSPTRPYYLVIPRVGDRPLAVVPSIMTETVRLNFFFICITHIFCHQLVKYTWLQAEDIRDWPAPRAEDDGVTLIAEVISGLKSQESHRIGLMMGHETTIRVPLTDIDRLRDILSSPSHGSIACVDGSQIVRQLRMTKSGFEATRMKHACDIASAAFKALPGRLEKLQLEKGKEVVSEREARGEFRILLLEFGADDTPYVMCQSGKVMQEIHIDGFQPVSSKILVNICGDKHIGKYRQK